MSHHLCVFTSACMFSPYISVKYVAVHLCLFLLYFLYSSTCVCIYICMSLCVCHPSINSVALAARGFLLRPRSSWQPGGDRVRGGLLGHAVVADHRVEAASGVGILGSVVSLQRGRNTSLVL